MRETFKVHVQGLQLLKKACPGAILSTVLMDLFEGIRPYFAIFMSARLLGELAGACRGRQLLILVIITLLGSLLLTTLGSFAKSWKTKTFDAVNQQALKHLFASKLMEMDFTSLDDPHTHELLSKSLTDQYFGGYGLIRVEWQLDRLLKSLTAVFGAVALSVGLFFHQVPAENTAWTWLNHPLIVLAAVLIALAVPILSASFSQKGDSSWQKYLENQTFGNKVFRLVNRTMSKREFAADTRLYKQDDLIRWYQRKYDMFGPSSEIARTFRGGSGLAYAAGVMVSLLFVGLVYLLVGLKAYAGAFGIGEVTQYAGALTALTGGLANLLRALGGMKVNTPFLKNNLEFLGIESRMYQGTLTTEKRSDRQYDVEFRNVSFRYPNTDAWALKNVSLKFNTGSRLAIVGRNGSGKTTFIKLLCRLYDPTEGEILLNGIDIRKYQYDDYLKIFSVVFQDYQLLSFPLAQNVAASTEYDTKLVQAALDKAGFSERTSELPKSLETALYREFDEEGVEISGGEAQKIAIARALYKNAPFIVLDEPTAALDPKAEAEIYGQLNEIVEDRTAIFISHRLSSCRFCDEIAVFDEGQLVQKGTHEELLADECGKYHELWTSQAKYYQ